MSGAVPTLPSRCLDAVGCGKGILALEDALQEVNLDNATKEFLQSAMQKILIDAVADAWTKGYCAATTDGRDSTVKTPFTVTVRPSNMFSQAISRINTCATNMLSPYDA
jgi:hypothetical protein